MIKKFDDYGLFAEDNKDLIGKKAKFKNNLKNYSHHLWNKTGEIVKTDLTKYLYLKFDEPHKYGYGKSCIMEMCVIGKDSIDLTATN